jgi:hypothetical protein
MSKRPDNVLMNESKSQVKKFWASLFVYSLVPFTRNHLFQAVSNFKYHTNGKK